MKKIFSMTMSSGDSREMDTFFTTSETPRDFIYFSISPSAIVIDDDEHFVDAIPWQQLRHFDESLTPNNTIRPFRQKEKFNQFKKLQIQDIDHP